MWIRTPDSWVPRGRSWARVSRSLLDHLLVRYPIPSHFYNWWDETTLTRHVFCHVAAGDSLAVAVKSGLLPVPLTRKMCHLLYNSPPDTAPFVAIRRAQVLALDGDERLAQALVGDQLGRGIVTDEPFWQTVIHWLCRQAMLDTAHVAPLLDYIRQCRRDDPAWTLKGRSLARLQEGLEAWHASLAGVGWVRGKRFPASGFESVDRLTAGGTFGGSTIVRWVFEEILTGSALAREGCLLRHCVYGYGDSIARGGVAIWSLRKHRCQRLIDDEGATTVVHLDAPKPVVTVEVCLRTNRVVQARGRGNRLVKPAEASMIRAFAAHNRLGIHALGL